MSTAQGLKQGCWNRPEHEFKNLIFMRWSALGIADMTMHQFCYEEDKNMLVSRGYFSEVSCILLREGLSPQNRLGDAVLSHYESHC